MPAAPISNPAATPTGISRKSWNSYLRFGFRAVKLRSGLSPREDAATALAMRAQMGPDLGLMVDFNQSNTPRASIDAASRMQEANLLWMEEPAVPADVAGYQLVSSHVTPPWPAARPSPPPPISCPSSPPAASTSSSPTSHCAAASKASAASPPWPKCTTDPCSPMSGDRPSISTPPCNSAPRCPQLRGGGPTAYPFLEYDAGPNPLRDLAGRPPLNADGTLAIPNTPGLGFDLTPEQLAPFVVSHRVIEN